MIAVVKLACFDPESKDSVAINPPSDSTGPATIAGEESGGVYCTIDNVQPRRKYIYMYVVVTFVNESFT